MNEEIACPCGAVAHIIKKPVSGNAIKSVWVIECPKCHNKVLSINKDTAIRNFR